MFNPLNLITKFIKSSNQKELDRIGSIVKKINSLEEEFVKLNDLDFPKKTQEFKEQIIEINAKLAKVWPIISEKKDALPDADEFAAQTNKRELLKEE